MPAKKTTEADNSSASNTPDVDPSAQFEVKISRAVDVMGGVMTLRPRDKLVVSETIRAELEAQGALLDAKPV